LKKYPNLLLPERERVLNRYIDFFKNKDWAILPPAINENRSSSFHLFALRIRNISETQRDAIIHQVAQAGVSTNVHFIPLPMLSLFKGMGYDIGDYPNTYRNYAHEISLPIYPQLEDAECLYVAEQIEAAYNLIVKESVAVN